MPLPLCPADNTGPDRSCPTPGPLPLRRSLRTVLLASAAAFPVLGSSLSAVAQSAAPGASVRLPAVSVSASAQTPDADARERLQAVPGGVSVIGPDDRPDTANRSIADTLKGTPGVVVQSFFGGNDQPRIQIRGSGLQQNPVERGILVLQDGLPLNRADGSYSAGFANLSQGAATEVYRGYTANRLGATVLGGALNTISPTGLSTPGAALSVEGGSFGHLSATARAGAVSGSVDGMAMMSHSQRDGYRDHNQSSRSTFDLNSGITLSDTVSTRFFLGYTDLSFDVAGPLSRSGLKSSPRQVHGGPVLVGGQATQPGPNVRRDRPEREATQFRLGNRTSFETGHHLFDVGVGLTVTDDTFRFPISSGIRDTSGTDATLVARHAYAPNPTGLPLVETTLRYVVGQAERSDYLNQSGQQGALFGRNDLDATTLSATSTLNLPVGDGLTLSPSLTYSYATRDSRDTFGSGMRPTIAYNPANPSVALPNGQVPAGSTSYDRSYSAVSPSLGLSWVPAPSSLLFAAVSRSFEPPTHDDLLATVNGTPNSSAGRPAPGNPALAAAAYRTPDLKAQTATTLEAGWRGPVGPVTVDSVVYTSWVKNELLSLRDSSGAPLGAINAGDTRHSGLELGVSAHLSDGLDARLGYTLQDFRFRDDPVRGDNRLAGAPPHVVSLSVQYAITPNWSVGSDLDWMPAKTPVDNMNTLYNDPYAVVGLRTGYQVSDSLRLFGEVRNLFDKTYASSTLVVDQAQPTQAVYLPGDGRSFYAGLKATF